MPEDQILVEIIGGGSSSKGKYEELMPLDEAAAICEHRSREGDCLKILGLPVRLIADSALCEVVRRTRNCRPYCHR